MKMRELEKQTELERTAIEYMDEVYESIQERNPFEVEFLQAVKEIFDSLLPVFIKNPQYMENGILERIVEPERLLIFRVPWSGRYW